MKNKLLFTLSLLCISFAAHADIALRPQIYYSVSQSFSSFFHPFSTIKWMEVPYLIFFFISLTIITTIIAIKTITLITKKKIIKLYFLYALLSISLIFSCIFGIYFRNCFPQLLLLTLHPEDHILIDRRPPRYHDHEIDFLPEPQLPKPPQLPYYKFLISFHESSIKKFLSIFHIVNKFILLILLSIIIISAIIALIKKRKLPIIKPLTISLLHSLILFIILFSLGEYLNCKAVKNRIEYNGKEYTVEDFQKEFDTKKILKITKKKLKDTK